jgi:type I restriction enzyme M protein
MNHNIKAIVHELNESRNVLLPSINSTISLICLAFASYQGITIMDDNFQYKSLEAQIKKALCNKQLSNALEVLGQFVVADELMVEHAKLLMERHLKRGDWIIFVETILREFFLKQNQELLETPKPLNQLCLALLKPTNGTFYDGVAGIGSTAFMAHKYALDHQGHLNIYSQEKNTIYYAISIVRAYMKGIDFSYMCNGDTLLAPLFYERDHVCRFDYSIMFPPLGLSWKENEYNIKKDFYNRFLMGFPHTSSADWLFVQHLCASLNENGKGIIAIPSGALYHISAAKIRYNLIQSGLLECVISFPPGMLINTNIPISLLVINRSKRTQSEVLMIEADKLFEKNKPIRWRDTLNLNDSIIKQIVEIYESAQEKAEISIQSPIENLIHNDSILIPGRHMNISRMQSEFGALIIQTPFENEWLTLSDVGQFYRGINMSFTTDVGPDGEYPIIKYADVQDGKIIMDQLSRCNLRKGQSISRHLVAPDDILIACKGSALKLCMVPKHVEPTLLSINFAGLRVDKELFSPQYVWYYLNSPAGQTFLKNKQVGSTTIFTLSVRDLESIPIPFIPIDKQNQYAEKLSSLENQIEQKIQELYTQANEAKWDFYESIGLGKIMKKENESDEY